MSEQPKHRSIAQAHYQPQLSPSDLFSGKLDELSNDRAFRVEGHTNSTSHPQYLDGGNRVLSTKRRVLKEAFDLLENDPCNRELFENTNTRSSKTQVIDQKKSNNSFQLNVGHSNDTLANKEANVSRRVIVTRENKLSNAFDLLLKTSFDLESPHHYDGGERISKDVLNTSNNKTQSTVEWLNEVGLGKYERQFESNSISLDMLGRLSLRDLKRLIPLAEDRLRFRKLIATASFTSSTEDNEKSEFHDLPSGDEASNFSAMMDYDNSKSVILNSSILSSDHKRPTDAIRRNDINDATANITPQNTQGHALISCNNRPTSYEVTDRIGEFFPDTDEKRLNEGLRNSRILTKRFSAIRGSWRESFRYSKRMSSISNSNKLRLSGLGETLLQSTSSQFSLLGRDDEDILELLDKEDMSPLHWTRGQLIGTGSFGNVYLAFNTFTGDVMAVKQVKISGDSDTLVKGLKREVEFLRELDHENIVQYRGFKRENTTINIFLEYVSGGSLASYIQENGVLSEKDISQYIKQCLHGLSYLHDRGIIHRDIKGANILLDNDHKVKISDFGLSKQEHTSAQRFSMQGTAYWMAPEVARASKSTTKADIWSLGCLVIEIYNGEHPYPELTTFQAIFKIGSGIKPHIPTDCSSNMKDFLSSCFEIDPEKRASAEGLLSHPFIHEN